MRRSWIRRRLARTEGDEGAQAAGVHRDDVLRREQVEDVEDRAVLLEDPEIDILPADAAYGLADRRLGEHGRALLDHLEEEDLLRRLRLAVGVAGGEEVGDAAVPGQQQAERRAEEAVEGVDGVRLHVFYPQIAPITQKNVQGKR